MTEFRWTRVIAALQKDLPEFDAKPLLEEAKSKYSELFKQADEVVEASKKRISELEQDLKETAAAKVRHCTIGPFCNGHASTDYPSNVEAKGLEHTASCWVFLSSTVPMDTANGTCSHMYEGSMQHEQSRSQPSAEFDPMDPLGCVT